MAAAPKLFAKIASAIAGDTAAIAPIAWYTAKIVRQEMEKSVKDLLFTQPSPPLSGLDSSSDEAHKNRKDRRSKKKAICRNSSLFLSDNET